MCMCVGVCVCVRVCECCFCVQKHTEAILLSCSYTASDCIQKQSSWVVLIQQVTKCDFNTFQSHFCAKWLVQKQLPRGVSRKKCSENMQQIYRITPMSKCDFNKVTLELYWNHTLAWVFSFKFAAYFQSTFSQEHLWVNASVSTY